MTESLNGSNILITGGLGFIGSNLAHRLVRMGANVILYDALLEGYGGNLANIEEIKDKVNVVIGDVREYDKLKTIIKEDCIDIIYHCAAQVSRIVSMSDPILDIEINCIGTINVLEAARNSGNNEIKIIYTGSRAATGYARYLPVDEETLPEPADVYGVNKLAGELYCKVYYKTYGLKTVTLRLNNCYGPRAQLKNPAYGVINWFIRLALEDKTITVHEPGTQLRDYVYIEDVIDALLLAAQYNNVYGETFYVGSEKPVSLIDLANLILKLTGSGKVKIVPHPIEWKQIEIGDFYVDCTKIKRRLRWKAKTSLKEGLMKTINFYKRRLHEYI